MGLVKIITEAVLGLNSIFRHRFLISSSAVSRCFLLSTFNQIKIKNGNGCKVFFFSSIRIIDNMTYADLKLALTWGKILDYLLNSASISLDLHWRGEHGGTHIFPLFLNVKSSAVIAFSVTINITFHLIDRKPLAFGQISGLFLLLIYEVDGWHDCGHDCQDRCKNDR